jgi:glycosyltransferase involved in cell wall biosynthesis
MVASPTVSVVTPSYNQVEYIEHTLDSVANQRYPDVEHVVVDGESDDGTVDVLRERDVQWVSEPDDGQADAINKGFDMVNGDVIGWLNSDDVFFDEGVLDRVVRYFEATDADVVYGDMALIDDESTVTKLHPVPAFDFEKLVRYCYIVQPSVFFRSDVIDTERLDPELKYVMDYEFWLRLGREYRFTKVDDVLSGDRNHAERKILHDREQMLREAAEIAGEYGRPSGWKLRMARAGDAVTSGLPRRLQAMAQTYRLHRDTPELAFDGDLAPLPRMLGNIWRSNKEIL